MKTFLLNILGLNESGYLACDRLGNSLILLVHTEKSSVFLLSLWSQNAVGKGLIGSRLLWIFHELVCGAEWLRRASVCSWQASRIHREAADTETLWRIFRGRAGLIKGFLTALAYRPSIYAAVASGSLSIWSPALWMSRVSSADLSAFLICGDACVMCFCYVFWMVRAHIRSKLWQQKILLGNLLLQSQRFT